VGLVTVAGTCAVNYLAAMTVGTDVPVVWVLILTPLTALSLYSVHRCRPGGQPGDIRRPLFQPDRLLSASDALAMSLAMQVIIYASSLPGGVLWWGKRPDPLICAKRFVSGVLYAIITPALSGKTGILRNRSPLVTVVLPWHHAAGAGPAPVHLNAQSLWYDEGFSVYLST